MAQRWTKEQKDMIDYLESDNLNNLLENHLNLSESWALPGEQRLPDAFFPIDEESDFKELYKRNTGSNKGVRDKLLPNEKERLKFYLDFLNKGDAIAPEFVPPEIDSVAGLEPRDKPIVNKEQLERHKYMFRPGMRFNKQVNPDFYSDWANHPGLTMDEKEGLGFMQRGRNPGDPPEYIPLNKFKDFYLEEDNQFPETMGDFYRFYDDSKQLPLRPRSRRRL